MIEISIVQLVFFFITISELRAKRTHQAPTTVTLGGVAWSLTGEELTIEYLTMKLSDAKKSSLAF